MSAASRLSSTTRMRRASSLAIGRVDGSRPGSPSRAGAAAAGRRTVNVLPRSGPSLCAATVPPCSSVSVRTSDRPSPRPPCERSEPRGPCTNISNTCGSSAGSIPRPLSRTRSTTSPPSRAAVTSMRPPAAV